MWTGTHSFHTSIHSIRTYLHAYALCMHTLYECDGSWEDEGGTVDKHVCMHAYCLYMHAHCVQTHTVHINILMHAPTDHPRVECRELEIIKTAKISQVCTGVPISFHRSPLSSYGDPQNFKQVFAGVNGSP